MLVRDIWVYLQRKICINCLKFSWLGQMFWIPLVKETSESISLNTTKCFAPLQLQCQLYHDCHLAHSKSGCQSSECEMPQIRRSQELKAYLGFNDVKMGGGMGSLHGLSIVCLGVRSWRLVPLPKIQGVLYTFLFLHLQFHLRKQCKG